MKNTSMHEFTFKPEDNDKLIVFCGHEDQNIRFLEKHLHVKMDHHGALFQIRGSLHQIHHAEIIMQRLYDDLAVGADFGEQEIHRLLKSYELSALKVRPQMPSEALKIRHITLKPHGDHQRQYIDSIRKFDINFSIGPSGTGKTYLAVAMAVEYLQKGDVDRLVLVRPAIEAGESLGYLPGDMKDKVDPYLRPLYDALFEFMGAEKVNKLIEKDVIEIAPLAYMRGRTLNDAFIIMDESQNTTPAQMKMFLTRIGFGSKAVITGDVTQIDLPKHVHSGLIHCATVLQGMSDIGFSYFQSKDVVRHPLVQQIVEAYEQHERETL
jgi:phosphate starvation-inducible protein PhoH and related proteins